MLLSSQNIEGSWDIPVTAGFSLTSNVKQVFQLFTAQ